MFLWNHFNMGMFNETKKISYRSDPALIREEYSIVQPQARSKSRITPSLMGWLYNILSLFVRMKVTIKPSVNYFELRIISPSRVSPARVMRPDPAYFSLDTYKGELRIKSLIPITTGEIQWTIVSPTGRIRVTIAPSTQNITFAVYLARIIGKSAIKPSLAENLFKVSKPKVKWLGAIKLNAANFASTKITELLRDNATTVRVENANVLPDPPFRAVISDKVRYEIVEVTAKNGNVLTIKRGMENTSPRSWPSGALFENRWTAGMFEEIKRVLNQIENYLEVKRRRS